MLHPLPTVQLESLHFGPTLVDEPSTVYEQEPIHKRIVDQVSYKKRKHTSTRSLPISTKQFGPNEEFRSEQRSSTIECCPKLK
jgi:hypothetical protein